MKNIVVDALEQLGLSEKEALVYKTLLTVKKGTALSVSEQSGIKRPTAYLVLKTLRQKKLVASTLFRGVRDYRAMPLENLKYFVRKQKQAAQVHVSMIQRLYDARQFKVRLRIYHGLSDVKTLLEKSLRERTPLHIFGDETRFASELREYWQFYQKRAHQHSIQPKFKLYEGPATLLLWSDKVAFIEFSEKPQVFGFKNKELHDVYQNLWNGY